MRTVFLLLLAMLAIKTAGVTTALGQDVCSNHYISCLDKCVARPSKALQDGCMESCQTQNNACYSQKLGGPSPNSLQTVKQDEPGKPADALAAEPPVPAKKSAKPAKPVAQRKPQQ